MKATLGIISLASFLMMLSTAEELGFLFVLSLVAFAISTMKFNRIK